MPRAIFINPDDSRQEVDVEAGTSLMRAATDAGIDGIAGDCGGGLTCATCHVLIDPAFVDRLDGPTETEEQMLDFTAMGRQPTSRLSCQVIMTELLDGLTVTVADPQV